MKTLYRDLDPLIQTLTNNGVIPIFVGGCVRDYWMDRKSLDIDIELYNVSDDTDLKTILLPYGTINEVGKAFGVFKLQIGEYQIDLSLPRTESSSGKGHRDFTVQTYRTIGFKEAARRRDFTINAIGYDPIQDTFLDPYEGINDIRDKTLRCVDPETFIEDPLRLLRAVQFAARFEFVCDPQLINLCRSMVCNKDLEALPKERIFEEIKKLLLLSQKPSIGLQVLEQVDALEFFSPLHLYQSTPQDSTSHPEGSLWIHTLMCIDTMASLRTGDSKRDLSLMFGILLHDCGKPSTTITENGCINAPGHAAAGVPIAQSFIEKLTSDKSLIKNVLPLVRHHGTPRKLFKTQAGTSEILKLSTETVIADVLLVAEADFFGRSFNTDIPETFEAGKWLHEEAERLGVLYAPPLPLLQGKDLISMGFNPSNQFKLVLDTLYSMQLDGIISTREEALKWAKAEAGNIFVTNQ